jgi:hypothetical protein
MSYKIINKDGEIISQSTFTLMTEEVQDAKAFIENAIMHGNTSWYEVSEYILGFLLDTADFHKKVWHGKVNAVTQVTEEYLELFTLLDTFRDDGLMIEVEYRVVYDTESDGLQMETLWASNRYEIRKRLSGNWTNIIAKEVVMD